MSDFYPFLLIIYNSFLALFFFIFSVLSLGMKKGTSPSAIHYAILFFIVCNLISLIALPYAGKEKTKKFFKISSLSCLSISLLAMLAILLGILFDKMYGGTVTTILFAIFTVVIIKLMKMIIKDKTGYRNEG